MIFLNYKCIHQGSDKTYLIFAAPGSVPRPQTWNLNTSLVALDIELLVMGHTSSRGGSRHSYPTFNNFVTPGQGSPKSLLKLPSIVQFDLHWQLEFQFKIAVCENATKTARWCIFGWGGTTL